MKQRLRQARHLAQRHLWPLRANRLAYLGRRLTHRWALVHRTSSPITGPITVWDLGRERRLVFGEHCDDTAQSVVFTRGSWAQLQREYWGHALKPPHPLPQSPRVLIAGLGGGTMVRLASELLTPAVLTVVELDAFVVDVARTHMGLDEVPTVEFIAGDVIDVVEGLAAHTRYDLVVEDIFFAPSPQLSPDQLRRHIDALAAAVAPGGSLVFNRWFSLWDGTPVDSGQLELTRMLTERGLIVGRKRIRQRFFDELIFAHRP